MTADLRDPDADEGPPALDPVEVITIPAGDWCAPWPDAAGGDGRAELRALIRVKNRCYHALMEGVLHCEQRRHAAGAVPPAWTARLAELGRAYRSAVEALGEVMAAWET